MDLRFSKEDEQFRASARAWLEANVPREPRPPRGPESAVFDRVAAQAARARLGRSELAERITADAGSRPRRSR